MDKHDKAEHKAFVNTLLEKLPNPNNTKLHEGMIEGVVNLTLHGATGKQIAEMLTVTDRTYRNWMKWGREGKGDIYEKFYRAVKSAEARTALDAALIWQDAMKRDWRAAKAFLESRWPDRWGKDRRRREKPQAPTPQPIVINVTLAPGQSLPDAVPPQYLPIVHVVEPTPQAIESVRKEAGVDG